jgi:hypothetical protein
MLATGCIVHVRIGPSGGPASSGPATYQEELAYAHCMRAHGLPNFPDPSPSGSSSLSWHLTGGPGSPAARANDACKHLLTGGSTVSNGTTATASPPGGAVSADCLARQPPCYTLQQIRAAYGIQPLLDRGITGVPRRDDRE